jgi:D-alanyl-D-alanine carboxypeptidase/D-alanyl-D-alanine-endopeptidase (penicillin-binding protein 4)
MILLIRRLDFSSQRMVAMAWTFVLAALAVAAPASAQKRSSASPSAKSGTTAHSKSRADVALFRERVEGVLKNPHARQASWGILVEDRDTGEVLYERDADRLFTPASNTKLFTSVAALALLGPDYRFHTTLESGGALGDDGRLSGDLVLVGRGDPDLSNRKFPFAWKAEFDGPVDKFLAELADAAVAKGLRVVDGDIVADDSYFLYDPVPAGWSFGDLYFTYGAPVSAIAFNDNSVNIEVRPGLKEGDAAAASVEPAAASPTILNAIKTASVGSKLEFGVTHAAQSGFFYVFGTIPVGHEPARLDLAMQDPAQTAAATLKQLLQARGVRVRETIRVVHGTPAVTCQGIRAQVILQACLAAAPPKNSLVLAEHVSPPLVEGVRVMNKISHNLHSELYLRAIAREKKGVGATDPGVWAVEDFLKSIGIAEGDVNLTDGSGLSENNLVAPRAVVALLRYAAQQPWGADFISTLPIAGVDGTLEDRLRGTAAARGVWAKTGGLDRVHALSGYATTLTGEHLIFSILENNSGQKGRDATTAVDAITVAIVETLGVLPSKKK